MASPNQADFDLREIAAPTPQSSAQPVSAKALARRDRQTGGTGSSGLATEIGCLDFVGIRLPTPACVLCRRKALWPHLNYPTDGRDSAESGLGQVV
jgi:hypothetical protein